MSLPLSNRLTPAAAKALSTRLSSAGAKTLLPATKPRHVMRRYEVSALAPNGDYVEVSRLAPAIHAFEQCFASLARGSVLSTDRGLVSIEDILPGDQVRTTDDGFQTVRWKGSLSVIPGSSDQARGMDVLTRISSDALGIARPSPDLVLGPCAHIYSTSQSVRAQSRSEGAMVPARDLIDGVNIIELTPPSAVPVFQLGFDTHQRVAANGVEVETLHPGSLYELGLHGDMFDLFMSMFPHVRGYGDFGEQRFQRLTDSDRDMVGAA